MSSTELVALVCCDLGGIVRGRSLLTSELEETLQTGVGWVPANHSLTPHGPLAEHTPFDSTGDLRLLPDPDTHVRVEAQDTGSGMSDTGANALELVLCDIVETDGAPWECCPRRFLRDALAELERELGARVVASFEHEFQLLGAEGGAAAFAPTEPAAFSPGPPAGAAFSPEPAAARRSLGPAAAPFSLEAQRRAEPFAAEAMGALVEAGAQPERIFAEFAPHQFEIPVEPAEGVAAADRAVVLREVVREVARRRGLRATFTPLLHPEEPGNGVHIHLNLLDADGTPLLYDATRPGCLSELGGRFAAGILRHAGALSALCAPSPVSAARLTPHRWSAGAVCVGERNREVLLRIPPLVALAAGAGAASSSSSSSSPSSPIPHPISPRSCAWSTAAPTPPRTPTWRSGRSSAPGSTECARASRRRRSSIATPRTSTPPRPSASASAHYPPRWRSRCGRSPRTTSCAGGWARRCTRRTSASSGRSSTRSPNWTSGRCASAMPRSIDCFAFTDTYALGIAIVCIKDGGVCYKKLKAR